MNMPWMKSRAILLIVLILLSYLSEMKSFKLSNLNSCLTRDCRFVLSAAPKSLASIASTMPNSKTEEDGVFQPREHEGDGIPRAPLRRYTMQDVKIIIQCLNESMPIPSDSSVSLMSWSYDKYWEEFDKVAADKIPNYEEERTRRKWKQWIKFHQAKTKEIRVQENQWTWVTKFKKSKYKRSPFK